MDQIITSCDDSAAKSISTVPCAACKFQRRKCHPSCPLAPYFPASNSQQFLNARRFFGVSNLCRALNKVKPNQRDDTAMTMIFEANTRAIDLVGGCTRIIRELEFQIEEAMAELNFVRFKLKACRDGELLPATATAAAGQMDIGFGMHMFEGMPNLTSSCNMDGHFSRMKNMKEETELIHHDNKRQHDFKSVHIVPKRQHDFKSVHIVPRDSQISRR